MLSSQWTWAWILNSESSKSLVDNAWNCCSTEVFGTGMTSSLFTFNQRRLRRAPGDAPPLLPGNHSLCLYQGRKTLTAQSHNDRRFMLVILFTCSVIDNIIFSNFIIHQWPFSRIGAGWQWCLIASRCHYGSTSWQTWHTLVIEGIFKVQVMMTELHFYFRFWTSCYLMVLLLNMLLFRVENLHTNPWEDFLKDLHWYFKVKNTVVTIWTSL